MTISIILPQLERLVKHLRPPQSEPTRWLRIDVSSLDRRSDDFVIADWINAALQHKKRLTAMNYLNGVLPLLRTFPDHSLQTWGKPHIKLITGARWKATTKNTRLAACRSLLAHWSKLTEQPHPYKCEWQAARPQIPIRNVNVLMGRDVERLAKRLILQPSIGTSYVTGVLLAAFYGMRKREIEEATIGDMLIGISITIVVQGKRDKIREIPSKHVPDEIVAWLKQWVAQRLQETNSDFSACLINLPNDALEDAVGTALKDIRSELLLTSVEADSMHHLRHWFVNRQLVLGERLSDIARWVGHSSPEDTARSYIHILHAKLWQRVGQVQKAVEFITCKALADLCGISQRQMQTILNDDGIKCKRGQVVMADLPSQFLFTALSTPSKRGHNQAIIKFMPPERGAQLTMFGQPSQDF